jgi:hypothetical protein
LSCTCPHCFLPLCCCLLLEQCLLLQVQGTLLLQLTTLPHSSRDTVSTELSADQHTALWGDMRLAAHVTVPDKQLRSRDVGTLFTLQCANSRCHLYVYSTVWYASDAALPRPAASPMCAGVPLDLRASCHHPPEPCSPAASTAGPSHQVEQRQHAAGLASQQTAATGPPPSHLLMWPSSCCWQGQPGLCWQRLGAVR